MRPRPPPAAVLALLLLLAPAPAPADITLDGVQHIGDCKPKGVSCSSFTQNDPVTRDFMFSKPINFHVSGFVMLDKIRLNSPEDLGNQLQIYLETPGSSFTSSRFGMLSGDTFDLIPDVPLAAGYYVLLPDGGCTANNNEASPNGFYSGCSGGEDNDFGFASITLVTADASGSVMFNRRRHIGDSGESGGSNVGYAGRWYPDDPDGLAVNLSFSLPANRRLDTLEFFRVRDVGAGLQRAQIFVDSTQVGTLTQDSMPADSSFPPVDTNLLLLAGPHTLRIQMPDPGDADDISWDDIVLRFAEVVSSGVPGFFNAVDSGEANVLSGPLRTKIAAGTLVPDIVAVNPLGTGIDTSYTGTVEVTLLNAASSSGVLDAFGCDVLWTSTGLSSTVTFAAANNGRVAMPAPFFDLALKRAVLKMRDTTTDATGCSTDKFALRPARFTVTASHDDEQNAGTTETLGNTGAAGLPRHRAGRPFTLQATALNAADAAMASYDGTPENTVGVTVIAPATTAGSVSIGTGGWTVSGALRSSDEAKYSEVGAVTLEVKDTTFADVDLADTTLASRTISGSDAAGRFVPHHFGITKALVNPGCGTFTYFGQSVSFPAAAVTLTAHDASHAQTRNYDGALYNLPATVAQAAFTPYQVGGVPQLSVPAGSHPLTNLGSGVATLALPAITVLRPAAPVGPLDLDFAVTLPVFADGDGIAPEESPIQIGAAAAGAGAAFAGNAKQLRHGRLQLQAVFGSERLPLNVPLRAEYFDGVTFVHNAADSCTTPIADPNAALSNPAVGQTRTVNAQGNGAWFVTLTAPGDARQVGVNMNLSGTPALSPPATTLPYPWLQPDTDNDGVYDNNPNATATFGLYSGEDRRVYQREVVGP